MYQHLRVTSRAEDMTPRFQLVPKLGVVENLTGRRNDYLAVFIGERLPRAAGIGDSESNVRKADLPPGVEPISIRASMSNCSGHPAQGLGTHTARRLTRNSCYAAHLTCSGKWFSAKAQTLRALRVSGVSLVAKWGSEPVIGERW
jgi:hypothetical protein